MTCRGADSPVLDAIRCSKPLQKLGLFRGEFFLGQDVLVAQRGKLLDQAEDRAGIARWRAWPRQPRRPRSPHAPHYRRGAGCPS